MTIRHRETNVNDYDSDESEIMEITDSPDVKSEAEESVEFLEDPTPSCSKSTSKSMKTETDAFLRVSLQHHEQRAQERDLERKRREENVSSDHLYHFFMSMYEIAKKMPIASQHILRNKVFQIVTQMEADLLNIQPY